MLSTNQTFLSVKAQSEDKLALITRHSSRVFTVAFTTLRPLLGQTDRKTALRDWGLW